MGYTVYRNAFPTANSLSKLNVCSEEQPEATGAWGLLVFYVYFSVLLSTRWFGNAGCCIMRQVASSVPRASNIVVIESDSTGFMYATKEEAKKALAELLSEKGVMSSWSWDKVGVVLQGPCIPSPTDPLAIALLRLLWCLVVFQHPRHQA